MLLLKLILYPFLMFCVWWFSTWGYFWFNLVEYEEKYDWCPFDNFEDIINMIVDDYKIEYGSDNIFVEKTNKSIYYQRIVIDEYYNKRNFIVLKPDSICVKNKYYMMLNPVGYLRYRIWLKINSKKDSTRIRGLWEEGNDNAFTS